MAKFDLAIPHTLAWEGGLVNHPNDPGGLTNRGITIGTFLKFAKPVLGINATEANLINLTIDQAKKIYKVAYWDSITGDVINSQDVANIYFDMRVNAGTNAVRLMQSSLREMGYLVTVDSVHGPQTLQAINNAPPVELYTLYKANRIKYYQAIATARPSLQVFLKGWLNRVASFPDLVKKKSGLV